MSIATNSREDADRKILIAVDFGTTFSGLAWAQTRKPNVQTPIIQWPDASSGGLEGVTSDKVPTEIRYDGQNYKWGFQIGDVDQRHQWFKLGLDPSQTRDATELVSKYPDPLASPPDYNIAAEKLVQDYLTALRKHAEQILRYRLPASALQYTLIEYIMTVPAVWSDSAQAKTRACAEKAGMGLGSALHMISEPEAAAMYALDAMDPHNLKVGDTFVVCDAGGGTVDLVTYTVSALKPILKLKEASPGTGSLCGASFLNRRFQKLLEKKLGNEPGYDDEVLEEAMKRFESVIKRQFRGTFGEEFSVPVPGLRDNAQLEIRRGRMRLHGTDLRMIFEPILNTILKLVMKQVKASKNAVKAVLLVGGFGQSAYLRDTLRQEVKNYNENADVMQSPNGWTAIVRGALMKGLASTSPSFATVEISARSARKHYGTASEKVFLEGTHDRNLRTYCGCTGRWVVSTMDWFIKKGDIVEEDKPHMVQYFWISLKSLGFPTTAVCGILVCSDPYGTGPPVYPGCYGVTSLANIKADLSRVPHTRFREVLGVDGQYYYELNFSVKTTYYSAYTKYELVHQGVNYGLVNAEYV